MSSLADGSQLLLRVRSLRRHTAALPDVDLAEEYNTCRNYAATCPLKCKDDLPAKVTTEERDEVVQRVNQLSDLLERELCPSAYR